MIPTAYPRRCKQLGVICNFLSGVPRPDTIRFMDGGDTGYNEALRRIRKAAESEALELDLTGLDLTTLPPEIGSLTGLQKLNLYGNQLATLPPVIASLTALYELHLSGNQFITLPPVIGSLIALQELRVWSNQLTTLPPEIASLTALQTLSLSDNQLTTLPPVIASLTALRQLDLDDNQLTTLPPVIASLTALQTLDLHNNQLTTLPPEIASLTALQTLYLHNNQLTTLPPEIASLTALQTLSLSDNQLTTLPPVIASLTALQLLRLDNNQLTTLPLEIASLTALQTLYLHNNQLATLPPEIASLTALQELYLSSNQLTTLPPVIASLTALRTLDLSSNQLTTLPPEIASLTASRTLDLSSNQFTTLPPEIASLTALRTLNLYNNQLATLPPEIASLKTLESLFLHGNPALDLPPEVLGPEISECKTYGGTKDPAKPSEILAYYFSLKKAKRAGKARRLNEAKVLFLGEPESGKSSLIHALKHGTPTPNFEQTDGIARETLNLKAKNGKEIKRGGEHFRLNLWDFGGQEIYKATHTFFLTKRAVYVIVTTARKDTRVDGDLEDWLETARTFGAGAPVWIAINKDDENPTGGPDEDALIRKYHPMLRGFIRTQCQHGKKEPHKGKGAGKGIDTLREKLLAEAWAIDGARQEMSPEALGLKSALEKMKAPTLSDEDYRKLCSKLKVPDETLQSSLLDLWDKLGTVRYFPEEGDDDPSFRQTAILNPEWVTQAVYRVLADQKLKKANGLVTEADFARITKALGHAAGTHHLIAKVMERFSQLYNAEDGRMFIPLLLDVKEPKLDWPKESLRFVYEYPVLPPGLVPSFIAKMYKHHSSSPPPWRKGCVLEMPPCRVRILGDKKRKQVEISVVNGAGSQQRDILDKIRFKFEELHAGLTGLDTLKELIPLPGYPDAPMLNYRFLRTLEDEGETHYRAPIDLQSTRSVRVSIAEALGNIRGAAMTKREDAQIDRPEGNVFVARDLIIGSTKMRDYKPTNIGGNVNNSQIGEILEGCSITINQQPPGEKRTAMERLQQEVAELIKQLPAEKQSEAKKLAGKLKIIVEQSGESDPDRGLFDVSANGLLEAATWVKDFSGKIGGTVLTLGKLALGAAYVLPKLGI
jgi:Leucine-rich repeat (LRR) protein